jgi:hypothetical protein
VCRRTTTARSTTPHDIHLGASTVVESPAVAGDGLELHLIALRSNKYGFLGSSYCHWGLMLVRPGHPGGDLYHARRVDLPEQYVVDPNAPTPSAQVPAEPRCRGCLPPITAGGHGFVLTPNYDPWLNRRQTLFMQTIVSRGITAADLLRVCKLVDQHFPYSLLQNNCQHFAIRVLRQLVFEGVLSLEEFDAVRDTFYSALVTNWKKVRNQSVDLRTLDSSATQG